MKQKLTTSEAGKKGAEATHKKRYEMIVELSKLIDKPDLDWIQAKWKTLQIATLIKYLRKNGRTN